LSTDANFDALVQARIKLEEGIEYVAYKPVPTEPKLTIGYGHYGDDVTPGMVIDLPQADAFFLDDYRKAITGVKNNCKNKGVDYNKLTKPTQAVLIDMTFNMGSGGLA
jgi:lysozyme